MDETSIQVDNPIVCSAERDGICCRQRGTHLPVFVLLHQSKNVSSNMQFIS